MSENINPPNIPIEPENPENAYLDPDNIPSDVLARLEAADSLVEERRKLGLSTLTPSAQQSLLDQITNGGDDPIIGALESQTRREIADGIFDLDSLRPDLRDILLPKQDDIGPDQPNV